MNTKGKIAADARKGKTKASGRWIREWLQSLFSPLVAQSRDHQFDLSKGYIRR